MSDQCSGCHSAIIWAPHVNSGKPMPLDAAPVDNGTVVLRDGKAVVLSRWNEPRPGELRYQSHFATCPDANWFRRN